MSFQSAFDLAYTKEILQIFSFPVSRTLEILALRSVFLPKTLWLVILCLQVPLPSKTILKVNNDLLFKKPNVYCFGIILNYFLLHMAV